MENSNKVGAWVVERGDRRRRFHLSPREFLDQKRIRCEESVARESRGFPTKIIGRQSRRGTRTLFTQIIPELARRLLIVNPFASVILRFLLSLGLLSINRSGRCTTRSIPELFESWHLRSINVLFCTHFNIRMNARVTIERTIENDENDW